MVEKWLIKQNRFTLAVAAWLLLGVIFYGVKLFIEQIVEMFK